MTNNALSVMPSATPFKDANTSVYVNKQALKSIADCEFRSHRSDLAQWIHQFSQFFLLPMRAWLSFVIRTFRPYPGMETAPFSMIGIISRLVLGILVLPFALVIAALGALFHIGDIVAHTSRPLMGHIRLEEASALEPSSQFQIASYNVALMYDFVGVINNTRQPQQRAQEMIDDFKRRGADVPDVVLFQEAFHQNAAQILFNGIKEQYPYIIYNVAPMWYGINSGLAIASKYPIDAASFNCFTVGIGPDKLAPKGVLMARVRFAEKEVFVYNTHLQAEPGKQEANVRKLQFQEIKHIIDQDKAHFEQEHPDKQFYAVLAGDFNVSPVTLWGAENNAEEELVFDKSFKDVVKEKFPDALPGTWYGALRNRDSFFDRMVLEKFEARGARNDTTFVNPELAGGVWATKNWKAEDSVRPNETPDRVFLPQVSELDCDTVKVVHPQVPEGVDSGSSDHAQLYSTLRFR